MKSAKLILFFSIVLTIVVGVLLLSSCTAITTKSANGGTTSYVSIGGNSQSVKIKESGTEIGQNTNEIPPIPTTIFLLPQ